MNNRQLFFWYMREAARTVFGMFSLFFWFIIGAFIAGYVVWLLRVQ